MFWVDTDSQSEGQYMFWVDTDSQSGWQYMVGGYLFPKWEAVYVLGGY